MQVIPVIDIRQGKVVHAVAGQRDRYLPLKSNLTHSCDPYDVAKAFKEHLGTSTIYLADLDSLTVGTPPPVELLQAISKRLGLQVWADANWKQFRGLSSEKLDEHFDICPIISLESLQSYSDLQSSFEQLSIVAEPIFSLDLIQGQLHSAALDLQAMQPLELAVAAHAIGFTKIIVLDIADVGMQLSLATLHLVRELRQRLPDVSIISGGGIRTTQDLAAFNNVGCSAVLGRNRAAFKSYFRGRRFAFQ